MAAVHNISHDQISRFVDQLHENLAFGLRKAKEETDGRTVNFGGSITNVRSDNFIFPGDLRGEHVMTHVHTPATSASFGATHPDNPNRMTDSPFRRTPHIFTVNEVKGDGNISQIGWTTGMTIADPQPWIDSGQLKTFRKDKKARKVDAAKTRNTGVSGIVSSTPRNLRSANTLMIKQGLFVNADTGETLYEHPESGGGSGIRPVRLGKSITLGTGMRRTTPSALLIS
jgi:hypothetical protein